ncbi:asparagine synthase, partial [Chytridium lagenaria]
APLAILFSGGIDCSVLAAFAALHLPPDVPIDLLNVAFENPRVNAAAAKFNAKSAAKGLKKEKGKFDVPDRKTGREGLEELKKRFGERKWRFVEVDVGMEEMKEWREWVVGLVKPLGSVMDLSIAIAFWFASRGRGTILNSDGVSRTLHQISSRIDSHPLHLDSPRLLSGLGADEQLGGYSRHRNCFQQSNWQGLLQELQLDVTRLPTRNLGRDDRIISDHGKEVRFPFLAEPIITFLSSLPVHVKLDPTLPRAVGDKLLLRQLAVLEADGVVGLGLNRAAVEAKRAVQFGARTAKMEDTKERGGDTLYKDTNE